MKKIVFSLVLFLFFSPAHSFDVASLWTPQSSVVDMVGVLKSQEQKALEWAIAELRRKYTVEILTVIIPSTDGVEISSLATEIGQKLGVGKADKDNGLVLLIAINDRSWNIATGYGVEGVLPDLLTKRIGEKNFVLFKDKRYYDGILWALGDFDKAFSGDTSIVSSQDEASPREMLWILQLMIAVLLSSLLFKPLVKSGEYKKFFLYFLIAYIITLPLSYYFLQNAFFFIENALVWIFWWIIGIFGKAGKWRFGSGSSWWWGGGFGGFWWGGFGWGGSSWKW